MKRILSILSVATLFVLIGCTDSNDDMEIVYDSIIEPDFTVAAAEIVAGVTPVTFTNTTSVEGTTVAEYFWHFGFSGEGNWSEEAEPDPIVYNQAGEYTVTLTAWGADGNRATVKKVVTVLADNVVPTADFSYSPMMVNVGDEVTFTDKSTDSDGEIVSREWVFPDGSTSTETNPSYTFTQKGMFQVKLTVTDDRGGESSATKSINVRDGDVSDFTLLWSTEVASADALCDANVVTVSDLGYVYAVTGEGKLVALDAEGAVAWEYDAAAQDKVNLRKEIAYPSVDADGTVYWVAHAYGDDSAVPTVYAFEGSTGSVLWKNQTAYAAGARIAFSTPSVGPNMVVVGSRGTNGAIRGFEKSSGRNTAQATPANGGGTSGTIVLKNGVVIFTNTGEYGYGIMVPDDQFVWSPVPTADTFAPGRPLPALRRRRQLRLPSGQDQGGQRRFVEHRLLRLHESDGLLDQNAQMERRRARRIRSGRRLAERRRADALHRGRCGAAFDRLRAQHLERFHRLVVSARCALQQRSGGGQPRTGACRHRDRTLRRAVARRQAGLRRTDRRHVRGFGLDLRVGLLLRAGQRRFGGQAQGLRGGAAGRKLRRGVGLVAVRP